MHFPQILLGFAATVSAIDIYLHVGGGCGGNAVLCGNINPNTCCSGSGVDIFPTVGFRGIPYEWNLETRGHSGGGCNQLREVQPARNTNFICLYSGGFSGGGYGFAGRKRDECASSGSCTSFQKPDTLLLEDGGKWNIADLEDAPLRQMVCVDRVLLIFSEVHVLTHPIVSKETLTSFPFAK
ncbi:hypothetical protein CDEST_14906 [Colletotrichum destructivum]|uniref:Uncharacterized protein n=1 Tax=Colletotrichum destructivum TaxID=34406 RepID=A0AAX4J3A3_9PEZI|nr:hypothetical protein CDEST_14906 [Colletotrichum destructivum]